MLRFKATNAQHIGSRSYQEDYFATLDPATPEETARYGLLSVVADGMGGMAHGDAAAQIAVKTFVAAYREKAVEEPVKDALMRSARAANRAVYEEAKKRLVDREMGTTLVATVVAADELRWVSVGDSGLFLLRSNRLRRLNRPHVFANILDAKLAAGEVTREQAYLHPQRDALTSFVGAEEIPEVDISAEAVPLQNGDVVLLASDGLFKTLSTAEITNTLLGSLNPAETLVQRALVSGGLRQDNVTVIAIQAGDKPVTAAQRVICEEETAELPDGKPKISPGSAQPNRIAWILLLLAAAIAVAVLVLR